MAQGRRSATYYRLMYKLVLEISASQLSWQEDGIPTIRPHIFHELFNENRKHQIVFARHKSTYFKHKHYCSDYGSNL